MSNDEIPLDNVIAECYKGGIERIHGEAVMQMSKEVRLTVDGVRRAAEAALVALDRFEADNNIITALEAGQAISNIHNNVEMMAAVLQAEAAAALERIQASFGAVQDDRDTDEVVVPFPGTVH